MSITLDASALLHTSRIIKVYRHGRLRKGIFLYSSWWCETSGRIERSMNGHRTLWSYKCGFVGKLGSWKRQPSGFYQLQIKLSCTMVTCHADCLLFLDHVNGLTQFLIIILVQPLGKKKIQNSVGQSTNNTLIAFALNFELQLFITSFCNYCL